MKKNLLTILILALLFVNLILTGITMFSLVSANKKTVALVDDIAAALSLDLSKPEEATEESTQINIADTAVYNIEDAMTIALKPSADGTEHYALVSVSFSLNKQDPDYETYQPMLTEKESKIKSEIIDAVGSRTKEEAMADREGMQEDILRRVQALFNSQFIYEAYFRDIKFQ
ncbi:MAG: flagellar basal body-associated FliL family protein [Lachnospiraceae bacterium]|nr:flagellar basal body-associated FliL family protein [Lachnospiraceae bacterium]